MFAKVLVREGIPEEAIITESQATDYGRECLVFAALDPQGTGRLFIITRTSPCHGHLHIQGGSQPFLHDAGGEVQEGPEWIPGESWVALRQLFRRFRAEPALNLNPKP